jgi:hypothetical protein
MTTTNTLWLLMCGGASVAVQRCATGIGDECDAPS